LAWSCWRRIFLGTHLHAGQVLGSGARVNYTIAAEDEVDEYPEARLMHFDWYN
jgi:hypothetical protein